MYTRIHASMTSTSDGVNDEDVAASGAAKTCAEEEHEATMPTPFVPHVPGAGRCLSAAAKSVAAHRRPQRSRLDEAPRPK